MPSLPSPSPAQTAVVFARLSRPYTDPMLLPAAPLPEPTYYQDPEARKQLREYLGSQHRFDEALEFGFPSPESTPTDDSFPIQSITSSDSADEDDASLETDGPSTPTGFTPHEPRKTAPSASFDSGVAVLRPQPSDRSRSSSHLSGREMTLRLTLTRPELRSSSEEDKLYSWQRTQTSGVAVADSDPLALAPLAISEDSTGAHGAFAGQRQRQQCGRAGGGLGLGRVWKSIRRH
ncbi:hypothetical protein B0A55_04470 [Friedmanniomyces simplex]|uniref:Uncharacterized protein n=1 Tax=Friedmanniomyces simplex TaxID=329884 RepID=A0A4U0XLK8_9PEZI|nr:hypothetical protein B0A55_04470 [Friedmanniomyces simplex]